MQRLSDDSFSHHSRVLVSQDRHEIYITIANYDDSYARYVAGLSETDSFLKMDEYGPFDISEHRHMFYLGRIMLALSLEDGVLV